MNLGAGGNIQMFSEDQAPYMQDWYLSDMARQQQQYQMSPPQQQYPYHQSLPGLQGPRYQYPAAVYQQQSQFHEAHYPPAFVAQAPMEPAYVYRYSGQQQQFYEQQVAMEPVYHYQPYLAEQQHGHQPAPTKRHPPANAPHGPRRHTFDPSIDVTQGGSRHPGRRRGPRHSDNGFHRPYPFASSGYEGYIINGSDNNISINDNMPRPSKDRPLASVPETPPRARPTIRLPGMNQPRTAYGIPGKFQNNPAAYNLCTNFQTTGALARGVEHPNRGSFTFGVAPEQSQPYNGAAMTSHRQGSRDSFTPAQRQSFEPRAATTTNMSFAPAASHTYTSIASRSSATGSIVGPAPTIDRAALALRQAQAQASTRSEPAHTHNVMPPSPAQAFATVNMPPIPHRPTVEQLSFGSPPSSSPIMTYNFPGQPLTARGQPIDLPRPRQNPLATVNSLVARGFDVPSEPVNQGNLAEQTLTNDLDNQARTAPAFERGELTFMDNGNYRRELQRRQHAAAQRAAERWAGCEISEEQTRKESKVRGWDIQEWKVAGEGGRARRYTKSKRGL